MTTTTTPAVRGAPPAAPARPPADAAALLERVLLTGDLSKLSPAERVRYYMEVCDSLGLNWRTRPFDYLLLNNKLILYARKDATDQLRTLRGISITIVAREKVDDLYVVTARATTPEGRTDESIGAVSLAGLKGEALSNALMKCESKAKRRVTLSICGLGMSDETETETIPGARAVRMELPGGVGVGPPPKAIEPGTVPPADTSGAGAAAEETVYDLGDAPEAPADPEPAAAAMPQEEEDPQALLDRGLERLKATKDADALRDLWNLELKPILPKLSDGQRMELITAKDHAKLRLGLVPSDWRGSST